MEDIYILTGAGAVVGLAVVLLKVGAWKGRMDEHRDTVVAFMTEIRADIKKVLGLLSPTIDAQSPMRLNDLGRKITEAVDAPAWAKRTAADLRERVEGKSPYDIQQFCFDYVNNEFRPDAEQDAVIKDCAFKNGVPVSGVLDVLAIELRDVLLEDQAPPY